MSNETKLGTIEFEPIETDVKYSKEKVTQVFEHILSFQKQDNQWSISNKIDVDTMIKELNKLGFYPNPSGKNLFTGV